MIYGQQLIGLSPSGKAQDFDSCISLVRIQLALVETVARFLYGAGMRLFFVVRYAGNFGKQKTAAESAAAFMTSPGIEPGFTP